MNDPVGTWTLGSRGLFLNPVAKGVSLKSGPEDRVCPIFEKLRDLEAPPLPRFLFCKRG